MRIISNLDAETRVEPDVELNVRLESLETDIRLPTQQKTDVWTAIDIWELRGRVVRIFQATGNITVDQAKRMSDVFGAVTSYISAIQTSHPEVLDIRVRTSDLIVSLIARIEAKISEAPVAVS